MVLATGGGGPNHAADSTHRCQPRRDRFNARQAGNTLRSSTANLPLQLGSQPQLTPGRDSCRRWTAGGGSNKTGPYLGRKRRWCSAGAMRCSEHLQKSLQKRHSHCDAPMQTQITRGSLRRRTKERRPWNQRGCLLQYRRHRALGAVSQAFQQLRMHNWQKASGVSGAESRTESIACSGTSR